MSEGPPDPLVDLVQVLRPALELALNVARSEARNSSKAAVPAALWPFLTLARNPAPALRAALDSLEVEEFRLKVAENTSEDALGRTCWAFVNREAGWEQELGAAVQKVIAQGFERAAGQAQREAERSSRHAQMLARRLEEADSRHAVLLARLTEAERNLHETMQQLDERTTERDLLSEQRARAVRELKKAEARLAAQTEQLRAQGPAVIAAAAAAPATAADPAMAHDAARWRLIGLELEQLVGDAVGVSERLQALQSRLSDGRAGSPASQARTSAQRRRERTAPIVDSGLLSNSAAYLESLFRSPGLFVFVDGYNLSMLLWPQLDAFSQRRALVSATNSLAARTGARFWLVFDGVDEGSSGRPADGASRSGVELVFSSELIEADDEILTRVERLDLGQAVVVVSNDRRVQAGAASLGAEVVSSTVLRSFILSSA